MILLRLFSTGRKSKLAFIQSQYLKAVAASLRVGFCDEWKRGFNSGLFVVSLNKRACQKQASQKEVLLQQSLIAKFL